MLIKTSRSPISLLKLRLYFYSLASVHLILAALYLVNIDMSKDNNPAIQEYVYTRWKLLTSWFNLISLFYYPICLYCDWKEFQGKWNENHVRFLRDVKNLVMTSILFPTTMYSDLIFWWLWHKDPGLIAPVKIFTYLSTWAHHSLHTVSAVMLIIDLLLVPRQRPDSLLPGLVITVTFISTYMMMGIYNYLTGIVVYAFLPALDIKLQVLFVIVTYLLHCFFYTLQWRIVDRVWC